MDGDFFERAEALRPGTPEVAHGLSRATEGQRSETIAELRARAAVLESEERWAAAAEAYGAVLELDPSIRFAREGRRTAT